MYCSSHQTIPFLNSALDTFKSHDSMYYTFLGWSTLAPFRANTSTTAVWPFWEAMKRGVVPSCISQIIMSILMMCRQLSCSHTSVIEVTPHSSNVTTHLINTTWKFRCFIFTTNPKPRGIPSSACSATSSLESPVQKAEPLRCLVQVYKCLLTLLL